MKKYLYSIICLSAIQFFNAQISDTIRLSRNEAEAAFMAKNLDLVVQKIEISQAEAQVIQAKYWPNPNFSLSEVNLWKNGTAEEMPAMIGNWGRFTQVSMQVEQVIKTAGKRRKSIELQKIELNGKQFEFQETLRELKKELRNTLTDLIFNQEQKKLYESQVASIQKLTKAYKNQFAEGNISKSEYIRLKAQEVELSRKLVEINQNLQEQQDSLKALLLIPAENTVVISEDLVASKYHVVPEDLNHYFGIAKENRPDILLAHNDETYAQKNLELQNALKTPDVTFSLNYDRGGSIMRDFVGAGVSFELPIFDRNKGNIQTAKLEVEKKKIDLQKNILKSQNEIVSAFRNYKNSRELLDKIEDDFEASLDKLLQSHEKNFRQRNINMLEFLDFVGAYIENKNILLETKKELNQYFENLQYAIGQDIQ